MDSFSFFVCFFSPFPYVAGMQRLPPNPLDTPHRIEFEPKIEIHRHYRKSSHEDKKVEKRRKVTILTLSLMGGGLNRPSFFYLFVTEKKTFGI